jgi:PleD family two-component response regulator
METAGLDISNVRALRPLRVLVAARDRRFTRMARFLLARNGFEVESTLRPRDVLAAVDERRADIVILDGSESLADAARTVAVFEARHPHVTVVLVVDDEAPPAPINLPTFPKWKSFEQLVLRLESMHLTGPAARQVTGS